MAAWTVVTITITFLIIKGCFGLRVSEEEEIVGLDSCEHGLTSAYAAATLAQRNADVKVVEVPALITGIYKVGVIDKLSRYDGLKKVMNIWV